MKRIIIFGLLFCSLYNAWSQSGLKYLSKSTSKELDTVSIDKSAMLSKEAKGLLYGPIDPNDYHVGPGDEFLVSIPVSVTEPIQYKTIVSPEGRMMLQGIGTVDLENLTLEESYERIKQKISSVFKTTDIDIMLCDVRQFKVTIGGEVVSQTVTPSYATERVYDAIQKAGGLIEEASVRNIELIREGETILVDIPRYLYLNDSDANPFLSGGDKIYVPPADEYNVIEIGGEVKNPGVYEFREGDKLADLIHFAKGFTSIADKEEIHFFRYDETNGEVSQSTYDLSGFPAEIPVVDLKAGDRVYARQKNNFYEGDYAVITGEVFKPGRYQITSKIETLEDLLREGGGFKPNSSLKNTTLYRKKNIELWDREMARLSQLKPDEMNSVERVYFYSRINELYGAVSTDFTNLGDDKDIKLVDLDSVHVPGLNTYVNVQGRVNNPGLIKYKKGMQYKYYIKEAGGFSSDADDSEVLISKNDGSKFDAEDDEFVIEAGDNILVPPEEPLDTEKLITNIIAISAQVLAIISIGISLNR